MEATPAQEIIVSLYERVQAVHFRLCGTDRFPVDVGDVFSVRVDEEHGEDGKYEAYHQDCFSFYKCKYFLHNVSRFCKIFSIISHVTTR